jgi:hypothetical protein
MTPRSLIPRRVIEGSRHVAVAGGCAVAKHWRTDIGRSMPVGSSPTYAYIEPRYPPSQAMAWPQI